jgi:dopamine beta-monooxygenase
MPNYTIPTDTTSYKCMHFDVPSDQKYHVVQYDGLAGSKYVHHMIIYACSNAPTSNTDGVYDCKNMDLGCQQMAFLWAPGAGSYAYPPEAGFAIGSGANSFQHFSLQVHYNNVNGDGGNVDASGFRLHYSKNLRANDVGVMAFGNVDIKIPGNSPATMQLTPNLCPSSCTQQLPSNVKIISTAPHMHLLGQSLQVQHVRNGQELEPIIKRDYYDFK